MENAYGILASKYYGPTRHNGAKAKGCKRHCFNCDNLAMVEILKSGKTRDVFLATCARNVWLITAMFNIDIIIIHVPGIRNQVTDLLSRWTVTCNLQYKLKQKLPDFCWTDTHIDLTKLNYFT